MVQSPISDLIEIIKPIDSSNMQAILGELRSTVAGCPACMLATIIQSNVNELPDEDGNGFWVDFEYKKEKESFMQEMRDCEYGTHRY